MGHTTVTGTECAWHRPVLRFMIALCVMFQGFDTTSRAGDEQDVQHYKMISTVEYDGETQFRNQVVTVLTVTKEPLPNDKVRYSFFAHDPNSLAAPDPNLDSGREATMAFSFVIDKKTQRMSEVSKDLAFYAEVHNESVKSLDKVTRHYVGKTWKQSVDLSSIGGSLFDKVRFTLTAIQLTTRASGEMIAVRALSEPFFFNTAGGRLRAGINTVYLFDSDIEDIYLSISVFEATTNVGGSKETLRHEVATYKTDAAGVPVDLSDVGKEFERLVAKVGLSKASLKVAGESRLPQWAHSKGFRAAQIASICSAAVCEGALNPVVKISMPTARLLALQREAARRGLPILWRLASGFGWNWPTFGVVGGTVGAAILFSGGGDGGGGGFLRPASPR